MRFRELRRPGLTKSIMTPAYCLLDALACRGASGDSGHTGVETRGLPVGARAGGVGPRLGRHALLSTARSEESQTSRGGLEGRRSGDGPVGPLAASEEVRRTCVSTVRSGFECPPALRLIGAMRYWEDVRLI
ncbi:hypothetical protein NDU88_002254 [Pleurodeles waltl]|uniref:Uncharacterized protein n=1 Tax=Pleurodeles waltl TaxID=8319 RepID=A0AAV7M3J5_PLEWA|nr:hypothetical protein NDU88_002254 [Pleurodeles waltl]